MPVAFLPSRRRDSLTSKVVVKSETQNPPSDPPLTITVTTLSQASRLTVAGELDLDTASILDEALEDALRDGDVDVDLSGVSFMDSSGIRTLLSAHDRCSDQGHRLTVVAASSQAARLIDIVGAAELLGLAPPD